MRGGSNTPVSKQNIEQAQINSESKSSSTSTNIPKNMEVDVKHDLQENIQMVSGGFDEALNGDNISQKPIPFIKLP